MYIKRHLVGWEKTLVGCLLAVVIFTCVQLGYELQDWHKAEEVLGLAQG